LGSRRSDYLQSLLQDIELDDPPTVVTTPNTQTAAIGTNPVIEASGRSGPTGRQVSIPRPRPHYMPTRTLRITSPEIDLLDSLTALLPGPRAVKKLTNIYRLILMREHHRREAFRNGEYRAAAIMAAGLVFAPEELAELTKLLQDHQCRHDTSDACDVGSVIVSSSCTRLREFIVPHIGAEAGADLLCIELYRRWSLRVACYSFETYDMYQHTVEPS
jgi:hypothetical protein